ncbi:asparagine synthase (glutamine-hydrolyzing) [Candidatus Woesearchaeota archaeon]|nr:asparagine synthase (glutamine-hydrolyzing) [Candidatus Woesearchaeota archaeon]
MNWEEKNQLQRMMKAVAHRGPDQHGSHLSQGISLGHQRLSIVDVSEKGRQPMYNEDGTICVILNGEIYNHQQLRNELIRHRFTSNADTEVLVHGYEEWGVGFISKLNGMFAFALYDDQKKLLLLGRDRVGIKPLYYYWKNGKLLFASEIKALLAADIPRTLRKESVGDMLQYGFVPSPSTMWEDIHKLPPGHYAVLKDGQLELKKYWDITFAEGGGSREYYALGFRALLKQCVKQQLMSDVPYGAYLSGGLDSSSVVASMASLSKQPVRTFSVGFDSPDVVDETKYASLVAEQFSTDHQAIIVTSEQVLGTLPILAHQLDEPIANAASIPLYHMAKQAKKKVTVVLTGNGGDELFGGYRQHKVIAHIQRMPAPLGKLLHASTSFLSGKWARYAQFGAELAPLAREPAQAYAKLIYKSFPDMVINDLGFPHQSAHERLAPFFATQDKAVNQVIRLDMRFMLAENYLMVDDKVNMAHAVESRVPYLDNLMLEFAAHLPVQYKVNGLTGKYLVRYALKDTLPKEILSRSKYGFTPPVKKWSETVLKGHCNDLFGDKHVCNAIGITHQQVARLLEPQNPEHGNRVFPLALLGEWAKQYLV